VFSSQARKKILFYYYEVSEWGPMCGVNDNVIAFQLKLSAFLFPSSPFWPVLTNPKHLSLANTNEKWQICLLQLLVCTLLICFRVCLFSQLRVLLLVCLHFHQEFHVSFCLGIWWRNVSEQQLQNCLHVKFRKFFIVMYQVTDQSGK